MTSAIGNRRIKIRNARTIQAGAFTLIELILVMALLLIVMAVAAPSLSKFFRGRTIDSEARRLLSLTRYGQSRAASEGVPMVLWIDLEERSYGLHEDETFDPDDPKAVDFDLDKDLRIEVPDRLYVQRNLARIRFLPDGSITETSPPVVQIRDDKNESLWIVQSLNQLNYEVQNETNQWRQGRR
jgi:prepilin-type N-terminal cleavage/methylation domain-containing protein